MTPDMGPYIAAAWLISALTLGGLTAWALWGYQRRGR